MARLRAIGALVLSVAFYAPALAQDLQRLTVTQLTLSADTATPKIEVPFDLIITGHVREPIADLRNLDLPDLAELELLGDQHSLVRDSSGTTYTERIRVVAHHSGGIVVAPATLDAIDARDGKAKRYSSNSLSLAVGGGLATGAMFSWTQGFVAATRTAIVWLFSIAVLVLLGFLLFWRRPARALPEPIMQPIQPPRPQPRRAPTRDERLRDARTVLGADRSRPTVLRVRSAVREMVGANDAETLADVLRRIEPEDRPVRALLFALERAAFTHDGDMQLAIDNVIERLNDIIGAPA